MRRRPVHMREKMLDAVAPTCGEIAVWYRRTDSLHAADLACCDALLSEDGT